MECMSRHPDAFPSTYQFECAVGHVPVGRDIAAPLNLEGRPVVAKRAVATQDYVRDTDKRTDPRSVWRGFAVYETVAVTIIASDKRVDGHHLAMCAVVDVYGISSIVFQAVIGYPVVCHPFGSIESHLDTAHPIVVDVVAIDLHIATIVDKNAVFAVVVNVVARDGDPVGREHPDRKSTRLNSSH